MTTRAAIYPRKSSLDERTGDNRSTTAQERECRALAERLGFEVVEVYAGGNRHQRLTPNQRRLARVRPGHGRYGLPVRRPRRLGPRLGHKEGHRQDGRPVLPDRWAQSAILATRA